MTKKGRHTTLAKELKKPVAWLESFEEVRRVIIGISESCRHKYPPGTLKVQYQMPGGLALNAYSGIGVTNLYVGISPPERIADVMNMIKDKFDT